ncbi:MAG: phosphate acetyltransferase [Clostridia bacterium]|jgi:phosphate acetyltransferase|nr:phosphate acetyltransferase [Clostridia bacterium]
MNLLDQIKQKAASLKRTIVLAEGTDERTVKAAAIIATEGIANIIVLGDPAAIGELAKKNGVDLKNVTVLDYINSKEFSDYVDTLVEIRKSKGLSKEDAAALLKNSLWYGTMMVYKGLGHGMVAGAQNTTGDVLRPALQIIKTAPGISVVSGAFLMIIPKKEFGEDGIMIFADCAVTPNPTADQLAEIAYASAKTAKSLTGMDPKVAMLSFSTKGSAEHELVSKVRTATQIAKEKFPDLIIDGELQADAAIVPKVAASKAPGSPLEGKANVLVFPDLQAANIGYKLVQRMAGAEAIGPVLQGMGKPVNDLSRGCSVEDIVNTVAMTCCQE